MLLHLSTWPEVEDYLKTNSSIIIPIGSTEQHGPNGLIGTDAICAEKIAHGVGDKTRTLVAPTIGIGMAQHHMNFPGSMTLRPSTLIAMITDIICSLSHHGFKHLFFINGHGGNVPTVNAAFAEFYAQNNNKDRLEVYCKVINWWTITNVLQLAKTHFGAAEGGHATPSEVSLTWYAYPESQNQTRLSPTIAPSGSFYDATDFRNKFPDGRIGSNPALANKDIGKELYQAAVGGLSDKLHNFLRAQKS